MALNSCQWSGHEGKKVVGLHEVDAMSSLAAQIEVLSKKLDVLATLWNTSVMMCKDCGDGHNSIDCPIAPSSSSSIEYVDFVGTHQDPETQTVILTILDGRIIQTFISEIKAN